ncbi:MAG: DNA polymerase I, partial [Polyangiaceae bacterium]
RDVLYLIDLSGYVFRAYHGLPPLSSSRGEPTHAVLGTVNMLQKVVAERKPHMFAVAMDSKGPTFRHAMDERYKATRPPAPPDLSQQMARVEQIVRAWDVACFQKEGLEADDLIAAVTARALTEGWRVVIVSADKDLMQLVHDSGDRVVLWDSMRDRVFGASEVSEKFGVPPSRVRDWLALTGDASDNVPGVPGVGPKTAADLLTQFASLEAVFAGLEDVAKVKLRESLRAHEGEARLSQKLVTLDASAALEWVKERLLWGGADIPALRVLYGELEFHRQLAQLDAIPDAREAHANGGGGEGSLSESVVRAREACATDLVLTEDALERVVAQARAAGRFSITVQATTPDAVRAGIVGIALAVEPGKAAYIPIEHLYLGCPKLLAWETVRAQLAPALADERVQCVGHDLKRAGIALARAGAPVAGPLFDTMIAAYLLEPEVPNDLRDVARRELDVTLAHWESAPAKPRAPHVAFHQIEIERAAPFAGAEAEAALALAGRLGSRLEAERLDRLMRDVEMPLEKVLSDMEMRGVYVDTAVLAKQGAVAEEQLRALETDCKKLAGRDFVLRSRDQVEKILFDELGLRVIKRTPKGGRSTDADVLEALADEHPLPRRLLEYREIDKLKGTYIDALPRYVNPATGRIHSRFDQAVAATGRLSSSDPNLQNIPIRTHLGRAIRAAFVAPPGHVIVSADYSQIELRVLAHLSGDEELVAAFASGGDVHARTAALIFDKAREDVTPDERRAAKTINFGVIYGMGDNALAKQLGIPREKAARFIEAYFKRYAGVAKFMDGIVESARRGDAVRTLLGRRRFLPNIHSANRGLRMEAERVARNTPIQGTAADILKLAMIALGKAGAVRDANMVLTVHDELVFEVPEREAERAGEEIREIMAGAMKLAITLVVDVGRGHSWAEAH